MIKLIQRFVLDVGNFFQLIWKGAKNLYSFRDNELVKGSIVLLFMINIFNFLNYIYQLLMAKLLGPSDYAVLATLMSLVYIFAIPSETIQTIISKHTARLNSLERYGEIRYILTKSSQKSLLLASSLYIPFLVLSVFLRFFLKIDYLLFVITGVFIFSSFLFPITRGILQGQKRFFPYGCTMGVEGTLKVIFGLILVLAGFRAYGAVGAVLLAVLSAYLFSLYLTKSIRKHAIQRVTFKGIYRDSFLFLCAIISLVLMFSLDVIFAKRVFPPNIAGQYAFVSLMGKAILFLTTGIGKATFPLASEQNLNVDKAYQLFRKAFIMVSSLCVIALFVYGFFPKLVIMILSFNSEEYVKASSILFIVGLSFSFLAVTSVIVLYQLSKLNVKRVWISLIAFPILQAVLFSLFHSTTMEFSLALLASTATMFIGTVLLIKISSLWNKRNSLTNKR